MRHRTVLRKAQVQGAATLVVVMVLFLVMALLAAYANRGLLFEQRIAASYSRAALAQEVAEGGIEWVLAQLNGQAIDDSCKPEDVGGNRFADKYLQINPADRSIAQTAQPSTHFLADCTRDPANEGWACRCPAMNAWVVPAPAPGTALTPSFGISMGVTSRGGTFKVTSVGCTDSVADNCLNPSDSISKSQIAKATFDSTIALVSAVRTPPAAPLIVKGGLTMTDANGSTGPSGTAGLLGLHNADPRSAGSLLAIGGTWQGMNDSLMQSVPGTAPSQARVQADPTLSKTAANDVFKMFMGASPSQYVNHPSLRKVTCNGDCSDALEQAYKAGKRILWVDGAMSFNNSKTIGSLADPVLIIANGNVSLGGSFVLNGMLVAIGNLVWQNTGGASSLINGTVLVCGNMTTQGAMDIAYQQTIANQMTNRMGSFVRVPGGWIDLY